jgi:glutamine amidotransferase
MNKKVVIVDYQLGNLFSVNHALVNIGLNTTISSKPEDIDDADAVVLPGVGAFGDAMSNLRELKLVEPLKKAISDGKPFLGICLGLQLLFTESEEFGSSEGLNVIKGKVRKFPEQSLNGRKFKVPQITWNSIELPEESTWTNTPLAELENDSDFYFVHSFYVDPEDKSVVLTNTIYGEITYSSSVLKNNIFACQFHPEKSGEVGFALFKTWAAINNLV